jgi:hypothetical protein
MGAPGGNPMDRQSSWIIYQVAGQIRHGFCLVIFKINQGLYRYTKQCGLVEEF